MPVKGPIGLGGKAAGAILVGLEKLPAFPPVAQQLLQLGGQPDVPLQRVARVVESDAVMSGEVLRLANSALFAFRYPVNSIMQAIAILGLERLEGMVLTIAMRDLLKPRKASAVAKQAWRHNLASALAAEWLADRNWFDRGAAYTGGLLHEAGMLAVALLAEEELLLAATTAHRESRNLLECEEEILGINHRVVGEHLAQVWKLPADLQAVMAYAPENGGRQKLDLAAVSWSGCSLVNHLGFVLAPPIDPSQVPPLQFLEDMDLSVYAQLPDFRNDLPMKLNFFECNFMPG